MMGGAAAIDPRARRRLAIHSILPLAVALLGIACNSGFTGLSGGVGGGVATESPPVIYLTSGPPESLPREEAAAWAWLQETHPDTARQLQMIDLPDADLPRNAVIWWHYAAEEALPSISVRPRVLGRIANHLSAGGSALLTLIAASYVVPLGIEPVAPDTVSTRARFVGDGAELGGLQSRRGHPVVDRFWGGVFSAADIDYEAHPAVAYTGDRWPLNGRVWAVHQSERGVDADTKIGVEYPGISASAGTVLTLGAHCYFDENENGNRRQLEYLVSDALGYLGRMAPPTPPGIATVVPIAASTGEPDADLAGSSPLDEDNHYWEPSATTFTLMEPTTTRLPPEPDPATALNSVQGSQSGIEIRRYDDDAPFTLAVPAAVVLGSQLGRVDEFRVHPATLLRDLRIGIVRPNRGVTWLDEGAGSREFSARPEGDEIYYNDGELEISFYLTVDRRYPALVGLLAVRSPAPVELIATWRAEPGPGGAETPISVQPRIGWDDGAQAVVWRTGSGAVAKAGFGRETAVHIIGFDPAAHLSESGLAEPGEEAITTPLEGEVVTVEGPTEGVTETTTSSPGAADVTGGGTGDSAGSEDAAGDENGDREGDRAPDLGRVALQARVGRGATLLPLVIVGGAEEVVDVDAAFAELVAAPGRPWVENARYFREFLGNGTMGLLAPDPQLENAFKWAKAGVEALRTTLPGLGTAIASGYGATPSPSLWATTANAMGGSGALWASMAADAYGDRSIAASTLLLLATYQGVDGRIPDAVTAGRRVIEGGVATTPLFLVALDNHVRTWGDLELLEQLWPTAQRALDFMLTADADGDGLIDGSSRFDRFSDDRAVRTTIHLAALWGAALEAMERLSAARAGDDMPETAETLAQVRATLNDAFWNPNERRFNFAKRADGSFAGTSTVLPAVPMMFGLLEAGIANAALDSLASAELSRDWGVSLIGTPIAPTEVAVEAGGATPPAPVVTTIPPVGLPSPAVDIVSPVFTGWAALAEYASQRPDAGFQHLATNLLLLEHGNVGHAGDGFGTESFELHGEVPHLAASQAMTVLPVVWGMLGIRPDAVNGKVSISPQLPAGWNQVNVRQVRVGSSEFRLQVDRTESRTRFVIQRWRGPRDLEIRLSAHVPVEIDISLDAEIVGMDLIDNEVVDDGAYRVATAVVRPAAGVDRGEVNFEHAPFPRLVSPPVTLRPSDTSQELRVVRTSYQAGVMRIEVEGLPGRTYTLRLATPWNIRQVMGVPDPVFAHPEAGVATLEVTIPGSGTRYRPIDLEVEFAR